MEAKQKEQEQKIARVSLLRLEGVTKTFPGVLALSKVNLDIKEGEVHAVVGENGAGKSTLCNVITGIFPPDKGEIFWKGEKVHIHSPRQALDLGIRMVYQERNLIPFLTGAQNICLGEEEKKGGLVDEKAIIKRANVLKERLGTNIPVDVAVHRLSASARQMIEILRAFRRQPKLLLLDEPTASLTEADVETLFHVIDTIKKEGVSVVFISHKLPEVFRLADRISIFRNGQKVFTGDISEVTRESCIRYMVNRDLKHAYPEVKLFAKEKYFEVEGVNSPDGLLKDISFYVKKGEVVGLYGLVGSGRTELSQTIYGLRPRSSGKIILNGKDLDVDHPGEAIEKGVLLIPEDRRGDGIFPCFMLKRNLTISSIKRKLTRFLGLIKLREEVRLAKEIANSPMLSLKYSNINEDMNHLSGGNKQKVVIGRWVADENMKLLIMDEPTQGIDVGTKYEIYVLVRNLAKQGIGVIFISSEMPEILGVSDRLYVFRAGRVSGELQREEFSEEKVLHYALHE